MDIHADKTDMIKLFEQLKNSQIKGSAPFPFIVTLKIEV